MADKFNNKYRIPSNRLQGYDYGNNGSYFITICTKNRIPYFGDIKTVNHEKIISLSQIGEIAKQYWAEIVNHYSFVSLDAFQLMPDHLHGVIIINKEDCNFSDPYQNKFGPQSKNLASIIRSYKAAVKSFANKNQISFEWQERFYDRIIRDDEEFGRIKNYIELNAENWENNK